MTTDDLDALVLDVRRVVYYCRENGYTILSGVSPAGPGYITVVGTFEEYPSTCTRLEMMGKWRRHGQWGLQFHAALIREASPRALEPREALVDAIADRPVREKLLEYLARGLHRNRACALAGLGLDYDIKGLLNADKAFAREVQQAEAVHIARMQDVVTGVATGDRDTGNAQAAMSDLSRRCHEYRERILISAEDLPVPVDQLPESDLRDLADGKVPLRMVG